MSEGERQFFEIGAQVFPILVFAFVFEARREREVRTLRQYWAVFAICTSWIVGEFICLSNVFNGTFVFGRFVDGMIVGVGIPVGMIYLMHVGLRGEYQTARSRSLYIRRHGKKQAERRKKQAESREREDDWRDYIS